MINQRTISLTSPSFLLASPSQALKNLAREKHRLKVIEVRVDRGLREGREINYDEEIVAEVSDAPDVDSEDEKGGGLRAPSRWPPSSHTRHTGYRPYFEDSESDFSTRSLSSDEEVEVREHALCGACTSRSPI